MRAVVSVCLKNGSELLRDASSGKLPAGHQSSWRKFDSRYDKPGKWSWAFWGGLICCDDTLVLKLGRPRIRKLLSFIILPSLKCVSYPTRLVFQIEKKSVDMRYCTLAYGLNDIYTDSQIPLIYHDGTSVRVLMREAYFSAGMSWKALASDIRDDQFEKYLSHQAESISAIPVDADSTLPAETPWR